MARIGGIDVVATRDGRILAKGRRLMTGGVTYRGKIPGRLSNWSSYYGATHRGRTVYARSFITPHGEYHIRPTVESGRMKWHLTLDARSKLLQEYKGLQAKSPQLLDMGIHATPHKAARFARESAKYRTITKSNPPFDRHAWQVLHCKNCKTDVLGHGESKRCPKCFAPLHMRAGGAVFTESGAIRYIMGKAKRMPGWMIQRMRRA